MATQEEATDLIQLLHQAGGLYEQSETFRVVLEFLQTNKDATHMVNRLVDSYILWHSEWALRLLMEIKESHTKVLLDRLTEHLKCDEKSRLWVYNLLGFYIRRVVPWLSNIVSKPFFGILLKQLQVEVDVVNLVTGILTIVALLPHAPTAAQAFLSDILHVFQHGVSVAARSLSERLSFVVQTHLHLALYSMFHRLYGMFPNHTLDFIRNFLRRKENMDLFDNVIKDFLDRVRLHPLLFMTNKDGELSPNRWKSYKEAQDIILDCSRYSLDMVEMCAADLGFTTVAPKPLEKMSEPEPTNQENPLENHQLLAHPEVKDACKVLLWTSSANSLTGSGSKARPDNKSFCPLSNGQPGAGGAHQLTSSSIIQQKINRKNASIDKPSSQQKLLFKEAASSDQSSGSQLAAERKPRSSQGSDLTESALLQSTRESIADQGKSVSIYAPQQNTSCSERSELIDKRRRLISLPSNSAQLSESVAHATNSLPLHDIDVARALANCLSISDLEKNRIHLSQQATSRRMPLIYAETAFRDKERLVGRKRSRSLPTESLTMNDDTFEKSSSTIVPPVLIGPFVSSDNHSVQENISTNPSYINPLGNLQRAPLQYEMLFAAALPFSPLAICPQCSYLSYGVHIYSNLIDTYSHSNSLVAQPPRHLMMSPADTLDKILSFSGDIHSKYPEEIPHCGIGMVNTANLSPEVEADILRSTVQIQHLQVLFERYRREQHAQRSRRLLSKLVRLNNADLLAEDLQVLLKEKDTELNEIRDILRQKDKLLHNLQISYRELQNNTKSEAKLWLFEKEKLGHTISQLKLNIEDCRKDVRSARKENEGLKNLLLNQDLEILSLKQELKTDKDIKQKLLVAQKRLVLYGSLQESYRALLDSLRDLKLNKEAKRRLLEKYEDENRYLYQQQNLIKIKESADHDIECSLRNEIKKLNQQILESKKKLQSVTEFYHKQLDALKSRIRSLEYSTRQQQERIIDLEQHKCQLEGKINRLERLRSTTKTHHHDAFVQTSLPFQDCVTQKDSIRSNNAGEILGESMSSPSDHLPGQMFSFSPASDALHHYVSASARESDHSDNLVGQLRNQSLPLYSQASVGDLLHGCFPTSHSAPGDFLDKPIASRDNL